MKQHTIAVAAWLLVIFGGCEPAESVDIQPLPPENRPSAEARLGLPEVRGVWRFAGWELPPGDSAGLAGVLPGLGQIDIRVQRLDSIAGIYTSNGFSAPVAGEVRRDSIVSLVTFGGTRSFAAGEVSGDTLWVTLSSLTPEEAWPQGGRAAFVRGPARPAFARLEGAMPPPPPSMAMADSLAGDSVSRPDFRPLSPEPTRSAPPQAQQAPPVVTQQPEPEPDIVAPVVTPEPDLPDLLGTPVVRDTTQDRQ